MESSVEILTSKEEYGTIRCHVKKQNIPPEKENFKFFHIGKTRCDCSQGGQATLLTLKHLGSTLSVRLTHGRVAGRRKM